MHKVLKALATAPAKQIRDTLSSWVQSAGEERYAIALTGLSGSGKSMLFTALIALLNARAKPNGLHALPLLSSLPVDEVKRFELRSLEGFEVFPIQQALAALQQQQWPAATDKIYGFELVLELEASDLWDKLLESCGGRRTVIFQFYDYPGEWLTDLPMLSQTYVQWAQQVNTQMAFEPLRSLSGGWVAYVEQFDFETHPTPETVRQLTDVYRRYLIAAKAQGLSLIQPSGFLLDTTGFDWGKQGFVPLPSKIFSDPNHLWFQILNEHFIAYQTVWLNPLYEKYFKGFDSQIVLVDVLSAAEAGLDYLLQTKEVLTQLASIFMHTQQSWWEKWFSPRSKQARIAFAATKADLLPKQLHHNLLSLLKALTQGAQAKYTRHEVKYGHFLISSIQATQEEADGLLYWRTPEEVRKRHISCFPADFKALQNGGCSYQTIRCVPPQNAINQLVHAQHLDRLLDYLLARIKEPDHDETQPRSNG